MKLQKSMKGLALASALYITGLSVSFLNAPQPTKSFNIFVSIFAFTNLLLHILKIMINTSKLIRMARKWQRKVAIRRKRISFPGSNQNSTTSTACSSSPVAEKGHVVVYTADQKRISFPIAYLNNIVFRELLKMAEEEFGLPGDGHITVPCDAVFMDYLISLVQRRATKDIEKALLVSISAYRCSLSCSLYQLENSQNSLLHCF